MGLEAVRENTDSFQPLEGSVGSLETVCSLPGARWGVGTAERALGGAEGSGYPFLLSMLMRGERRVGGHMRAGRGRGW